MKRFNSFILVPLLVFTIFIFSSCTNTQPLSKNDSTSNNANTATNQSAFENKNAVSQDIFENDLHTNPLIINCHSAKYVPDTPFSIVEYNIDKRKIDEDNKTDTIYCTILLDNTYLSVSLSATLYYSFYDVGGWILDELSIDQKSIHALCAPDLHAVLFDLDYSYYTLPNVYAQHKFSTNHLFYSYVAHSPFEMLETRHFLNNSLSMAVSPFFSQNPENGEMYQSRNSLGEFSMKRYVELPISSSTFDEENQTVYIQYPRKTSFGIVLCDTNLIFDGKDWILTQNCPNIVRPIEVTDYFDSLPSMYYTEENTDDILQYTYSVSVNTEKAFAQVTKNIVRRSNYYTSYNAFIDETTEIYSCDIDFVRGVFVADDREFLISGYSPNVSSTPVSYTLYEFLDSYNSDTFDVIEKIAKEQ